MKAYSFFSDQPITYLPAKADLKVNVGGVVPSDLYRRQFARYWHREYVDDGPPRENEVLVCVEFLSRCARTKTGCVHSYHLKHVIERWSRETGGIDYVSNGAAIEAARRLGIALWAEKDGINCYLGVSRKSVYAAAEIRP